MISTWIHGISGKMGQALKVAIAQNKSFDLLGGSDQSDLVEKPNFEKRIKRPKKSIFHEYKPNLVIDFSSPAGTQDLLEELKGANYFTPSVLICTTGLSQESLDQWMTLKSEGLRVLISPNTSLGIFLMAKTAMTLSPALFEENYDIEIEETHHRFKKDAPSGTALFLSKAVQSSLDSKTNVVNQYTDERKKNDIGVHVTRGGGVFGEHKIRFIGQNDEVCLTHRAFSRSLFAEGALIMGKWLEDQLPGYYNTLDIDIKDLVRKA